MLINEDENKFALFPHHCKYWWDVTGWHFDHEFHRLRERIGLDTHIIQFHSVFKIEYPSPQADISLSYHPVIQFHNRADLVRFRLMLPE